jgi:peroxiredoxin
MLRKLTPVQTILLVLLAVFTVFITWRAKKIERTLASHDAASEMRGKQAPEFLLASLDGRKVSMSEFRGKKKVVVNYWASWCGPCRVELPELKRFYEKYHKEDSDFEILAVSIDEDRESAESFAFKAKLPFPVLLDLSHNVADAYSVEAIPTMFIVQKDGHVSYANTGLNESLEIQLGSQLGINMENIFKPPKADEKSDDSSD